MFYWALARLGWRVSWVKALSNPARAVCNAVGFLRHPVMMSGVFLRAEGLLTPCTASLLYDSVISSAVASGSVLDVGCHKGLSTCFLSLAAQRTGRQVIAFDSFRGLPEADPELDRHFHVGQFAASPEEFECNVSRHGRPETVRLVVGDVRETVPLALQESTFAVAFVDVDICSVAREVLASLDAAAVPGARIILHDIQSPGVSLLLDQYQSKHNRYAVRRYADEVAVLDVLEA